MAYTGKKPVDFVDVTQSQSMTVSDDLTVGGEFTSSGIDDNATSTAMTIDSSGNVVVKAGKELRINRPDDATFGAISHGASGTGIVYNDANGDGHHWQLGGSEKVRIDSSGNVGIGTTSLTSSSGYQTLSISGSTGGQLAFQTGGAGKQYIFSTSTDLDIYNSQAGNIKFSTSATERMRIDSSGALLLGTTSAYSTEKLLIDGGSGSALITRYSAANGAAVGWRSLYNNSTGNAYHAYFQYNGAGVGSIISTASSTAFNTSSDYRLKQDWQPMTGATERVKALNPVNFAWKVDGSRVDGFLAHEAAEVVPEAVTGEKDAMREEEYEVTPAVLDEDGNVVTEAVMGTRQVPEYQGIDQSKLVPLLTAALQEAIAKIETLEEKVAALENA